VLVHHGIFWAGPPRPLDRASKRRLQLLFDADMSLAA
jgi:putative NIF3 family GTP cyclohydrolase 1 type 2